MAHVDTPVVTTINTRNLPALEQLHVPFAPLTLQRPLALFGTALGLAPHVPGHPDPDFIVHVLEGTGHQEQLRQAAKSQFRNLANFLRGAHAPTATSLRLMATALGIDEDALRILSHDRPDGPLLPAYVSLFQALEGLFVRMYRQCTVGRVMCSCCGADMLDDAHFWWRKQTVQLASGAADFIDRLLHSLLGTTLLLEGLASFTQRPYFGRVGLRQLANEQRHPIGNWMEMARRDRALNHDWQLLAVPVLDGRMRKWRSGGGLLPLAHAHVMMEGAPHAAVLRHALLAARTLSLAVDVGQAAALTSSKPSRKATQQIVVGRLDELNRHLALASRPAARA